MGQTLSEPVIDKHTAQGEDDRLAWGVSEMQGWRLTMEDAHAHVLSLGDVSPTGGKTSFFAVYDGHGGSTVAKFAGDTVHQRLAAHDLFVNRDYEAGLKRAFLATDEDLRANPEFKGDPSGCTAVAALITEDLKIICANSGDSRAVLSVGGEAKAMSYDHKPTNKGENSRIVAAGGFVEFGRVNGNLALSRALGDFEFKQNANLDAEHQIVTADPEIIVHEPTSEDEFLVIACDGIWDVLSSQQVIDHVRLAISHSQTLPTICESLMDRCLAPDSDWGGVGCDNMTVLIVAILGNRTKEEWYSWMKTQVENGDKGIGYKTPREVVDPFAAGPRGAVAGPVSGTGGGQGRLSSGAIGMGGALARRAAAGGDDDEEDEEDEEDDDDEGGPKLSSLKAIQALLRSQGLEVQMVDGQMTATGTGSAARNDEADSKGGFVPAAE